MSEMEPPPVPSDVNYVWVTPDHEVVLRELRGYVTLGMSNDGFWAGERTTAELPADAVRLVPDTGQVRETGADWAARPRRFSPEDTLSVAERLGAGGRRFCEGDCSCGHDHERHGREVPGCIECSCRITPDL